MTRRRSRFTFQLAFALGLSALGPSAVAQCQLQTLLSSHISHGDHLSRASISGDVAVLGAWADNTVWGYDGGAAYVFNRTPSGWAQAQRLVPSIGDVRDFFGVSVSISDGTIVVGAMQDYYAGSGPGRAFVYERTASGWVETAELTPSDGEVSDNFGYSVSISGDTILVGSWRDDDAGDSSGSAYLFERTPSGWVEDQKLTASDAAPNDNFGQSLSLDGDVAVIGASAHDGSAPDQGAAYVFERTPTGWEETAMLTGSDTIIGANFGYSVSVHGDRAVAGAPLQGELYANTGAAYVFERTPTGWVEAAILTSGDAVFADRFGKAVAVHGNRVAAGAPHNDDGGDFYDDIGAAYLFEEGESGWTKIAKFFPSDGSIGGQMGEAIAIHGETVMVGAWLDATAGAQAGSVHVFSAACGSSYCAALPNSTGEPASISGSGSMSVTSSLVLSAEPVPNFQPGLFYYGPDQVEFPFGDGIRCVGGQVTRMPVVHGSGGVLSDSLDVDATLGQITAGSTWNFQAWFRDPEAGGAGFNLSDGLEVTFEP